MSAGSLQGPAALIRRVAADARGAGLFLDFDGTIAAITGNPEESRLPEPLHDVLADLSRALGVVAVVSGRPAASLAERVPVDGVRLLGLYGLETWDDDRSRPRPEAARWQATVDDAKRLLAAGADGLEGVELEDKGLSVALHWRHAADRDERGRQVADVVERVAAQTGLGRELGKFVEELRPPVDWDKGTAVRAVVDEQRLRLPVYAGDDLGDLPALRAVRELGGVAVVVSDGETPEALDEAADVTMDGPEAMADWLRGLRDALA
ncbi:trehalose-phosphatase [soil metagenome]